MAAENHNGGPVDVPPQIQTSNHAVNYAKPLPDVSKIEVFAGQNFRRWQERVHTLLDMHGVVLALTAARPDATASAHELDQWNQANKVCRHTLLSSLSNELFDVYCSYREAKEIWDSLILKYTAEDAVRQRFVIGYYYRWTMNNDKDIKVQINEYHKLLEDLKAENITLPEEFVAELLIEKLPESWTDYKQQVKHRHKQTSLSDVITHIIIEDTNRKEIAAARAKALSAKANMVQHKSKHKRYMAAELATDLVINVGNVKFHLHKFPLLSKSARFQKLITNTYEENNDEVHINDIPGGPAAFEICAKFCYGMTVTLSAYNVIAARCAAEYLEMYETVETGNLIYKIEVFLNSSIFRSWKDSIIVLQTTKSLRQWSEELKLVSHGIDSIATKASLNTSKVEWSYTYNRKKLPSENGNDPHFNSVRKKQLVPKDWWVEDLCELQLDLYERVITTIIAEGNVSGAVIGEALNACASRRMPGFNKGEIQGGDIVNNRLLLETIIRLLPVGMRSVSFSFLVKLLRVAIQLECKELERSELIRRTGMCLEEAEVSDLLIRAPVGDVIFDIDIVQRLVEEFVACDQHVQMDSRLEDEFQKIRNPGIVSESSKAKVAKLVDGYLAETARDPNLPRAKFVNLAELVSSFPRASHDALYRAIDIYLKEHPEISKSERKRICRLMNCRNLSAEACMHAVQNERLPMRVVVQVLFFEQLRVTTSSRGNSTPDHLGSLGAFLPSGSRGSSRSSLTNTEEE